MNRSSYMVLAIVVLIAMTGCKKEDIGIKEPVKFSVSLANHKSDGAKVHFANNAWKPVWDEYDQIQINDGTGTVTPNPDDSTQGTFVADITNDTPYCAVYPAGLVNGTVGRITTINLPRVQVYELVNGKQKITSPMSAINPQRPVLEFKNLCGLFEINITNDKAWDMIVDSIHVETAGAPVSGPITYNLSSTPHPTVSGWGNNAKNIVSLAGKNGASMNSRINSSLALNHISAATDSTMGKYYVTLPPIADAVSITIRVFTHPVYNAAGEAGFEIRESRVHVVFSRVSASGTGHISMNEIVPVNLSLSKADILFTSMMPFTVDAGGTKVCFSRGYVQYNTSTSKWRFAPRQWSFLNQSAPNYHINHHRTYNSGTTWIEFFGWATGDDPTKGAPAATMAPASGSSGHIEELTRTNGKDWGKNFTNTGATWYTPSMSEYHYVFKDRPASIMNDGWGDHTYKFAWARIAPDGSWGVGNNYTDTLFGVILIPDGVNPMRIIMEKGAIRLGITTFKSDETAMNDATNLKYRNDNTYTKEQFEYLEAHGCIFFPCIGHIRMGVESYSKWNSANNIASHVSPPDVRIWSRTYATGHANAVYYALFDSGNPAGSQPTTRNTLDAHDLAGDLHCVRLVCPDTTSYKWDPDQM